MAKRHVFLSYCRDNQKEVAALRDDLLRHGETVWWDQDLLPGQDWKNEIRRALEDSYSFILCLSGEVAKRNRSGLFPEALAAIEIFREYVPGAIFIIPVKLSPCALPRIEVDATRMLDRLQAVELYPADARADAIDRLLEALALAPDRPSPSAHKLGRSSGTARPHRLETDIQTHVEQLLKYVDAELRNGIFDLFHASALQHPSLKLVSGQQAAPAVPMAYCPRIPFLFEHVATPTSTFSNLGEAVQSLGRRVVVIGPPGSGKTTALLDYAGSCVTKAPSYHEPIPVFAPIHSWTSGEPLVDWLNRATSVPVELLRGELQYQVRLLLDGLDELPTDSERKSFAEQLLAADFSWVVTCREAEFSSLLSSEPEGIGAAAVLLVAPLTDAQVTAYLAGNVVLIEAVAADRSLAPVTRTPLLLALLVAATASSSSASGALRRRDSDDDYAADSILEYYVSKRFQYEASRREFPAEYRLSLVYHTLGSVASSLVNRASNRVSFRFSEVAAAIADAMEEDFRSRERVPYAASVTAADMLELAESLQLIVADGNGAMRFKHLMLRDHFALREAISKLESQDEFERGMAAQTLCQIGGEAASACLIRLLENDVLSSHRSGFVLQSAIMGLGQSGDARAIQALADRIPELTRIDSMVTMYLERAIAALAMQHIEKVLDLIAHPNKQVRDFVGPIAKKAISDQQIPALLAYLQHANHDVRWWSVQLLATRNRNVWRWVVPYAAHMDPNVRANAVDLLGSVRAHEAVAEVIGALSDDQEQVRTAAVVALGKIGSHAALQALLTMVTDCSVVVRACVAQALAEFDDDLASDAIFTLSTDPSDVVKVSVAKSLGSRARPWGPDTLSTYLRLVAGHDTLVTTAATASGSIGATTAVPALLDALGRYGDSVAGYEICVALEKMGTWPEECKLIIDKHKVVSGVS